MDSELGVLGAELKLCTGSIVSLELKLDCWSHLGAGGGSYGAVPALTPYSDVTIGEMHLIKLNSRLEIVL